jgi:hypothetical protein
VREADLQRFLAQADESTPPAGGQDGQD